MRTTLIILTSFSLFFSDLAKVNKSALKSNFSGVAPVTLDEAQLAIHRADFMSVEEKTMMLAINHLRSDPQGYLPRVKRAYSNAMADSASLKELVSEKISTVWVYAESGVEKQTDTTYSNHFVELKQAYESLLAELRVQQPLKPLLPHQDLYKAAQRHAADQSPSQYIQHWGTDGTWPQDRIREEAPWSVVGNENIAAGAGSAQDLLLQLMVDSGVEGYGHRRNLLNPSWTHVACHRVSALSSTDFSWWLQEFAN